MAKSSGSTGAIGTSLLILGSASGFAVYNANVVSCLSVAIPHTEIRTGISDILVGETKVSQEGIDGSKIVCTKQEGKVPYNEVLSVRPQQKITLVGTTVPSGPYVAPEPEYEYSCPSVCMDGWCSQSVGQGTCSYHGGVDY